MQPMNADTTPPQTQPPPTNDSEPRATPSVEHASVLWGENGGGADAPFSAQYGDIYFIGDGVSETEHVFINGNDLPTRFHGAGDFAIGELGFGAGVNFLTAWRTWNAAAKAPGAHLTFWSIEKHPLTADDLCRIHRPLESLAPLAATLQAAFPPAIAGMHAIEIAPDVTLIIAMEDAADALSHMQGRFNAWFLDGFAPTKNPDMWAPALFNDIARLSAPDATFATYTVAGHVRRGLEAAGFTLARRKGFGRKREMLTGALDTAPTSLPTDQTPWFLRSKTHAGRADKIAIIGAGVAGASLAAQLTKAGAFPVIFDQEGLAAGASGNPAGLIMPRLDLDDGPTARFFRLAYAHTLRLINRLHEDDPSLFNSCGAYLKAKDTADAVRLKRIAAAKLLPPGWIKERDDGLFFPQAGVIDPPRFVHALAAATPIITATINAITKDGDSFQLTTSNGEYDGFRAVVIANGRDAARLVDPHALPLSGSLGQIDFFNSAAPLKHAIAGGPYAAPAPQGGLVIGATFERLPLDAPINISQDATKANIDAAMRLAPELSGALESRTAAPRAAARCQTPDRLPVTGPMPDWAHYRAAYAGLGKGERGSYPAARHQDGLYILTGFGARGLVTAPYCANLLAAEITGAPSPAGADIAAALHPARFFIRALRRGTLNDAP